MIECNKFIEIAKKELSEHIILKNKLQKKLENQPDGTLNIAKKGKKNIQYYNYLDHKRIYIPSSNHTLIKDLAQKTYDQKILDITLKRINALDKVIKCFDSSIIHLYDTLTSERQNLITTIFDTDDEYIRKWYESNPACQNPMDFFQQHYTANQEIVRSKSEKIIADMLYYNHIPYIYEPKLTMKDGTVVYPDIMALNVRLRKTYYIEHFGKMDDPAYADKTVGKIDLYSSNGYYPNSLICTFESLSHPLNAKNTEKCLKSLLL